MKKKIHYLAIFNRFWIYINSLYLVTSSPKGITFLLQIIIDQKKKERWTRRHRCRYVFIKWINVLTGNFLHVDLVWTFRLTLCSVKTSEGLIKGLVVVYTYICRCIGIGMFVVFSGSKWSLRKHEFIITCVLQKCIFLYILYDSVTTKPHFYSNFIHICVTKKRYSFFFYQRWKHVGVQ